MSGAGKMARDNFISDNLINIREKLRQDSVVQTADVSAASVVPETVGTQVAHPAELPAPAPRMQVKKPELDYERRTLIGKIRRDYTLAAAELEIAEKKQLETTGFMQFLSEHQKALEAVDFDRPDISRELDRLTWEYYQHAGRWKAFARENSVSESVSSAPSIQPHSSNKLLAAAIIISSIIISITLLAVFI